VLPDLLRLLGRYALLAAGVVLLNFFIPRLLPGDPLSFRSGEGADAAVPLTAAARDQLRAYYRLDEPLAKQLTAYLGDLARGDFGRSISRPAPVGELILDRLPWTLSLLLAALLVAALGGTAAGLAAGWRPGRRRDRLLVSAASALAAIPEFLIAIGLLLVFAVWFGWFPLFGGRSVFATYEAGLGGAIERSLDVLWHLTLPATALALAGLAPVLLLARDATSGLRDAPWLTVARGKGLPERAVARRHALPNVALPLLGFVGLRLGSVLGGALVVERVFGVPGLGLLGYQAVLARDYPLLQALFLLAGLGVLAANLLVDVVSLRLAARRGLAGG
jgi:peptide/nickel transport system permease protein